MAPGAVELRPTKEHRILNYADAIRRKGKMRLSSTKHKVIVGVLALLTSGGASAGLARTAGATVVPTSGSVEICKASVAGNLAVTGPFSFSIAHGPTVTVTAGLCSPVIPVSGAEVSDGVVTVTEAMAPWYAVTAITALSGGNYLTSSSLSAQTATMSVSPSTVSAVTFTDTIVAGYVEVCKAAAPTSGLTGTYSFNVSGSDGWLNGAPAAAKAPPINVTIGSSPCSGPLQMPAGQVTVTEAGTNLYVTSLTATSGVAPNATNEIISANLTSGTAVVGVMASTNASIQTIVNYTDDVVNFKVCKTFDTSNGVEPGGSSTLFPFSFVVSGVAGPANPLASVSIPAGACSNPAAFRAGTSIAVTEGIVPGTKVESITADGIAESVVPGSLSAPNRTVTVILGTPVTPGTGAAGNESVITYQDEPAAPGELKLCKFAGTVAGLGAPVGTSFSFNVSGVSLPVVVSLGSCTIVGTYPFNSTVTITEAPSTGNAVSAISLASSTNVTENSGTTQTNEPALTLAAGALMSGSSPGNGTSSVVIGENVITEVNYFDVDPPFTVVAPDTSLGVGPVITVGTPAVTPGASQNTAGSAGVSQNTAGFAATVGASIVIPKLTHSQIAARLHKLNHALTNTKAAERVAAKKLHHLKGNARKADLKRVHALQARVKVLRTEISLLH